MAAHPHQRPRNRQVSTIKAAARTKWGVRVQPEQRVLSVASSQQVLGGGGGGEVGEMSEVG